MSIRTYNQVFDELQEIECEHGLDSRTICNVVFWKILRFGVFRELNSAVAVIDKQTATGRMKRRRKIFFKSIGLFRKHVDYLIMEHPRKKLLEGKFVDPYTHNFTQQLLDSNKRFLVCESNDYNHMGGFETWRVEYPDFGLQVFSSILRRIMRILPIIKHSDIRFAELLEKSIFSRFGTKINIKNRLHYVILDFYIRKYYFKLILRLIHPNTIYLVVSYGKEPEIAAAKELGIRVVEFQHGSIGQSHPGYAFNRWESIPYFPDEILVFGLGWFRKLTYKNTRLYYYGNWFLRQQVRLYGKCSSNDKNILVISQWIISIQLIQWVIDFASIFPDYSIRLHLHPDEEYQHSVSLPKNVIVGRGDIAKRFRENQWVFGVSSTSVVESLLFECKVALINLSTMDNLIDLQQYFDLPIMNSPIDFMHIRNQNFARGGNLDQWF
jgi:hypothetical protein